MRGQSNRRWFVIIGMMIILVLLLYVPLPYFVTQPGGALELGPRIQIEDGYESEGSFMLTTIRRSDANAINYVLASIDQYRDLVRKETLLTGFENEEQFHEHQMSMMTTSQQSAIQVAYEEAGRPVDLVYNGIRVMHVQENRPAEQHLQSGDLIIEVDGHQPENHVQFVDYIRDQEVGETIEVVFVRDDEQVTVHLELVPLNADDQAPYPGLGIQIMSDTELDIDPPLEINSSRIGGPSAGVMFALEIYNQLTDEDMTKGYAIAGTGTINPQGEVGRIGGVHQKVVAAANTGADLFFVPDDRDDKAGNYYTAQATAEDIGATIDVVPIASFSEALQYLEQLEPR